MDVTVDEDGVVQVVQPDVTKLDIVDIFETIKLGLEEMEKDLSNMDKDVSTMEQEMDEAESTMSALINGKDYAL